MRSEKEIRKILKVWEKDLKEGNLKTHFITGEYERTIINILKWILEEE